MWEGAVRWERCVRSRESCACVRELQTKTSERQASKAKVQSEPFALSLWTVESHKLGVG